MADTKSGPSFSDLLATVATEPGVLEAAFSRFHNFSLGNMILAFLQCRARGIPLGPLATYPAWQKLGRQVRKGEKALELVMPVTCKRTVTDETGAEETATFTRFTVKPRWFVLAQTEGAPIVEPELPTWHQARTLEQLDITLVPFQHINGNVQGYAQVGRRVAVSPIAERPLATLVHEVAHVVLGHLSDVAEMTDAVQLTRSVKEVEAESVTLLVLGTLDQGGLEYCRGYVKNWLRGGAIDERTAQRIFKAADTILRAGRDVVETAQEAA